MKEFLYFLKWHWNKWDWTQRVYMLGAGFFGAGAAEWWITGQAPWQITAAFSIWGAVMVKWIFWDSVIDSWKTYKKEKADLFKTIEQGK